MNEEVRFLFDTTNIVPGDHFEETDKGHDHVRLFAKSARGHWGVESMHWAIDVTFGEDASRKRKDNAPRNYSLIRKFSLNILRTFKGKMSVRLAQIKASANADFFESILVGSGFSRR